MKDPDIIGVLKTPYLNALRYSSPLRGEVR